MTRPLALTAAILTLACDAGVVGVRDWTRGVVVDTASIEATLGAPPPQIWVTANADREWLEALYEATDGDNWKRRDNWLTDAPLSEWHGVRTDSAGRVIVLWMYDNGLRGVIPPETGYLGRLEELGLPGNQLWGAIPPSLGRLAAPRAPDSVGESPVRRDPARTRTSPTPSYAGPRRKSPARPDPARVGRLGES